MATTQHEETHKHRGEQGVGGTIITPRGTLAQFADIASTTAVWAILSAVIRHMIRASHCILKSFNQFIGTLDSTTLILVDHDARPPPYSTSDTETIFVLNKL